MKIQITLTEEEKRYERIIAQRLEKKNSDLIEFEFLGMPVEELSFVIENNIKEE